MRKKNSLIFILSFILKIKKKKKKKKENIYIYWFDKQIFNSVILKYLLLLNEITLSI